VPPADALTGARVLVTGATGFLGANLVRALVAARAEVHAVVRPSADRWRLGDVALRVHDGDLRERASVRAIVDAVVPDVVFHLAAHGAQHAQRERDAIFAGTVLATHHLLLACEQRPPRRLVHTGGSSEYGPKPHALAEDDVLAPVTAYGAAKAAATTLAAQAARAGLPVAILRPFSIYGPWEPAGRLVPSAIRAALTGATLPLTAGAWVRDYVFVDDVVDACLLAAGAPSAVGEIVNLGTGRQTSNHDVVAAVERLTGRRIVVAPGAYAAHGSDTTHWVADTRKAARLLGWRARHDLAAGLAETIAWTRATS